MCLGDWDERKGFREVEMIRQLQLLIAEHMVRNLNFYFV